MVDELLSQNEIDALLGGVSLDDGGDAGLPSEDREVLDEVGKVFSGALSDVTGDAYGKGGTDGGPLFGSHFPERLCGLLRGSPDLCL